MKSLNITSQLSREFPSDGRYLVGVSGGRDSVALLHWLTTLGYRHLIVCHLNHQLRGRSSDADLRFVKGLARKYGLNFEFAAADVRALAKREKMSIETAARAARYSFFANVAKQRRCRTILLAHHADDLVETFLINLFRGTGSAGLAAMREVSTRSIADVELTIARPLLGIWRRDIDKYVRKHRLPFREDASNKSLNALRNRIRHRLIPHFEKIAGRNIRPAIWRAAAIAGEEEDWIEKQLPDSADARFPVARIRSLPVALQRRTILRWLRAQEVSGITFDVIERVRCLASQNATVAKVNLSQDHHARRRAGKIFIE
jgi:tRNA(Ile)-lysidine synthase